MSDNTNIVLTAQAWADILIRNWFAKIERLHIGQTQELAASFINHVIENAGGSVDRIEFAFNYYGKFVDMGVGKGISLSDIGYVDSGRRPKKWYSPVFYSEVRKLTAILAEKYAMKAAISICETIKE